MNASEMRQARVRQGGAMLLAVWALLACGGDPSASLGESPVGSRASADVSGPSSMATSATATRLAYFGDSISRTDCCRLQPEQGYLARFVRQTQVPLSTRSVDPTAQDTINFAENGSMLQETLPRLRAVLAAQRDVTVVHVMSGMNHFLRMSGHQRASDIIEDYRRTLEEVVALVRGQGRQLVWSLTTPIGQGFGYLPHEFHARCEVQGLCRTPEELNEQVKAAIDGINQVIVEAGQAHGFLVLDTATPLQDAQGYLRPEYVIHPDDQIHPNATAHAAMAQVLLAHEADILRP